MLRAKELLRGNAVDVVDAVDPVDSVDPVDVVDRMDAVERNAISGTLEFTL